MLRGIHTLIDAADTEPYRYPPTLIYNEGWMLRLVLHWFERHSLPGHVLDFHAGATWYSEALLPTPFRARYQGDPRAEARTHADGIIGHIAIGNAAKGDAALLPGATQFVVTEAKMFSPLSRGTRNAPTYDQAARTVACIAETLYRAERCPSKVPSLALIVLAPQQRIDGGTITALLNTESVAAAVRSRAQSFAPELDRWIAEWFGPTLDAITIAPLSWEQVIRDIGGIDAQAGGELATFYQRCTKVNTSGPQSAPG